MYNNYHYVTKEEQEFQENKKWFDIFKKLPLIFTLGLALLFFILGIMFGVYNAPGTLLLIWVIGAIVCAITYFVYKVVLSYIVLHINYLEEILSCSKKLCKTLTEDIKEEE